MPVRVFKMRRRARAAGGGVIVVGVRIVGGRSLAIAEGQGCEYASFRNQEHSRLQTERKYPEL